MTLNRPPEYEARVLTSHVNVGLSPQHGMSLGCRWRRQPPDVECSCEYIE